MLTFHVGKMMINFGGFFQLEHMNAEIRAFVNEKFTIIRIPLNKLLHGQVYERTFESLNVSGMAESIYTKGFKMSVRLKCILWKSCIHYQI